ncbi:uncharacterized protein LOC100902480 [Galendromus occidentalis]|uniref:Uncharacterized protein LOC100902480 n=1 Tax=Galendromus occidentalis TaxID=34638 RepID=A0AAJ6QNR5_9ACAR|nr:uncharacterized protein LOC100902480 [Galendromus occidentalis]
MASKSASQQSENGAPLPSTEEPSKGEVKIPLTEEGLPGITTIVESLGESIAQKPACYIVVPLMVAITLIKGLPEKPFHDDRNLVADAIFFTSCLSLRLMTYSRASSLRQYEEIIVLVNHTIYDMVGKMLIFPAGTKIQSQESSQALFADRYRDYFGSYLLLAPLLACSVSIMGLFWTSQAELCYGCAIIYAVSWFFNISMFAAGCAILHRAERRDHIRRVSADPGTLEKEADAADGTGEDWLTRFLRLYRERLIDRVWVKTIVMLTLFVCLIIGLVYGTEAKDGPDMSVARWYGGKVSRTTLFAPNLSEDDPRNKYSYRIELFINASIEYWEPETHQRLLDMLDEIESIPHVSTRGLTDCWFRDSPLSAGVGVPPSTSSIRADYIEALKQKLRTRPFSDVVRDIRFDVNETEIVASRCEIHAKHVRSADDERETIRHLRSIVAKYPDLSSSIFTGRLAPRALEGALKLTSMTLAYTICFALFTYFSSSRKDPDLSAADIFWCGWWFFFSVLFTQIGVIGWSMWFGIEVDPVVHLLCVLNDYFCFPMYCADLLPKRKPSEGRLHDSVLCLKVLIFELYASACFCSYMLLTTETPSFVWISALETTTLAILFTAFKNVFLLPLVAASRENQEKIAAELSSIKFC